MAVPSTPGEERAQHLRRTRWALASVAVGGAVLATGAVAVLNGATSSPAGATVQGPAPERDQNREHDGGGEGLTLQQLQQLQQQLQQQQTQQQQTQQQLQQQYNQRPSYGGAPQTRSRGS